MLSFDMAAWDFFFVYDMDFMRELRAIAVDGCAGLILALRPLPHMAVGEEEWSDFRWQPDGAYFSFVQATVIVFIVIVTSMQSEFSAVAPGMPKLALPTWLRHDLSALQARFHHHGSQLERAMAVIRNTAMQTARHRALDPLMLDSVLNTVFPADCEARERSISAFIEQYNARVAHDSTIQLQWRTAARQCNLRAPARPRSDSQDKSSMQILTVYRDFLILHR